MREDLHSLRDVLLRAEQLPWGASLYLPKGEDWSLSSPCAVLVPGLDQEDTDKGQKCVEINNLRYVLHFSNVQDIVSNAKQQLPDANETQIFQAFQFYLKNDAFIGHLEK